MRDLIGRTLGHYRIVDHIGAGGMGEVYRAHDERLDRDVAIKVLPEEVASDLDRLARFDTEAKAVAKLNHPNILAIHDFGSEDGIAYAVMELLDGESLREVISGGGLSHRKAVEYARSIADGLAAAHDKGIVHRDLKPENVFLTRDGQIKILDFGLAKLHLPEHDLSTETPTAALDTKPGSLLGTVAYMAPEQVQGKAADKRSDLFALGVVMYEMLTGHHPFGGSTTVETAAAILTEDPQAISIASPAVPPTLAGIVSKCLEKRPEDRFSSAHDLSLTLGAIGPGAAELRPPGDSILRRRWPHILAVVIAGVIGLLFVFPPEGLFQKDTIAPSPAAPPRIVVLPFKNLGPPEDAYFAGGMTEEITARLATVPGFRVISRTSAAQYGATDKTIEQIGNELGADYVLEGTVRWARGEGEASRIRVTPQLIRVSDDTHLWTETYDRVIHDVFDVQSAIAQSVADHLGVSLAGVERTLVEAQPTSNLQAYQAYLRGRHLAKHPHFTYENWERVMAAYQQAVVLDPDFALAYAELARGHALLRYLRHDLTPERLQAADAAARRALKLAPESQRVHLDIGYYRLWAYRDVEGALTEFERAAADLPDNADVLEAKASVYHLQGHWDECLDASRRAFELSPLDADLVSDIGEVLWMTRRYPEAMAAFDQAMTLAPDTLWPYLYKAFTTWSWHGEPSESREILEAMPPTMDDWVRWSWYWQEMFEDKYDDVLDHLESTSDGWLRIKIVARPISLFAASAYEHLDETEKAEAAFENARNLLEAEVAASPEDPRLHSSLGIVYAAQGRHNEAIREGKRACELLPRSKDGFYYLPYVIDLAHIYTILGDNEAALERLDYLLSNPSWITEPFLRMDPRWDPLRDDPRFEALLEKHTID